MNAKFYFRIMLAALFITVTEKSNAQAPEWLWAEAMGGIISKGHGNSIAVDLATGDVYTSGYFSGTFDFDPGPGQLDLTSHGGEDIFISKCNSLGQFRWAKAIGGIQDDVSNALAVNSETGDVFITGYFTGTVDFDPGPGTSNLISTARSIFISKLDSGGNFEWAKGMGGSAQTYGDHYIAVDPGSEDVYITGFFTNTVDFDPGAGTFNLISDQNGDMFISKLSSSGDFVWAITLDGMGSSKGKAIDVDPQSGSVYTLGHYKGLVDFDPGPGVFTLIAVDAIFISKFDSMGNFIWAKQIGGAQNCYGIAMVIDREGNGAVYTAGEFIGRADFNPGAGVFNLASTGNSSVFISKLTSSGDFVWAKKMGSSVANDYISVTSIAFDTAGSGVIYTSGNFHGEVDFDPGQNTMTLTTSIGNENDIYFSKLDTSGNFVWVKQIDGPSLTHCSAIAVDPTGIGAIYSTGYAMGTVDFDPSPGTFNLPLYGDRDIFISKLSGMGHFIWAETMSSSSGSAGLNSMTFDPTENKGIYTTGTFSGTFDFDLGPNTFNTSSAGDLDMYISKLDTSGQFLWAKSMRGSGWFDDLFTAVDPGSGDIYVAGNFIGTFDFDPGPDTFNLTSFFFPWGGVPSGDMFISKLDVAGNFVWAKEIEVGGDLYVTSIAVDPSGNGDVYTTGYFNGTVDFDPGPDTFNLISDWQQSMFISKLDSTGNFVWAKAIGGGGDVYSFSLTIDPENGAVYTTGWFIYTVDFDPGSDSFNLTSDVYESMFISKLDNSGDFEWAISGGSSSGVSSSGGSYIVIDPAESGDIYVAGYFYGTFFDLTSAGYEDIYIAKLDGSGHFKWAKGIGGAYSADVESLVVDPVGNKGVYVAGHFFGTVDFDPGPDIFQLNSDKEGDMFISKLDGSGNFEWTKSVNVSNDYDPCPITLDHSGHLYVAGSFQTPSISFGATTLFNADSSGQTSDIFIAKLDTTFTTSVVTVDSKNYQINIYPNPATNELNVSFEENEVFKDGITMFNILGEVVLSSSDKYPFHKKTIDVSTLPAGIYFVEVNMEGERVTRKIVKE